MMEFPPYTPSRDLSSILAPVFEKWHKVLPEAPCVYRAFTQDFGLEVKELLISKSIEFKKVNPVNSKLAGKTMWDGITFLHTPENMELVGKRLGIAILSFQHFLLCARLVH